MDIIKDISSEFSSETRADFNIIQKNLKEYIEKGIQNATLSREFLDIAKSDLNNAKILIEYRNLNKKIKGRETIPLTIFLIQQSVEKYVKAYSLITGSISKTKFLKEGIGHESGKGFIKCLRNPKLNNIFGVIQSQRSIIYSEETKKSLAIINFQREADDLQNLINSRQDYKLEITNILDNFEKINILLNKGIQTINKRSFLASFTYKFQNIFKRLGVDDRFLIGEKDTIRLIFDLISLLYPLAFITPEYEQTTRYPALKKKEVGYNDFREGRLQITKEIPRIIQMLEKIDDRARSYTNKFIKLKGLSKIKREKIYEKLFKEFDEN